MPPVATAVQLVPLFVLISHVIVPLPLPVKATVPLAPLHTEPEVVENAAATGACCTVILTILLRTGEHTANASLTTARYHLSPTIFDAVIEVVVTPNDDQVV